MTPYDKGDQWMHYDHHESFVIDNIFEMFLLPRQNLSFLYSAYGIDSSYFIWSAHRLETKEDHRFADSAL